MNGPGHPAGPRERGHREPDVRPPDPAGSPADLVTALGELARELQREAGTARTLDTVVGAATAMIPGAEEGSISVVAARRTVRSWGASGDLPRALDALQSEVGQGPCLDAAFASEVVHVPDLATETRWPAFTERAARAGAGSMLCLRLFVSGDDLGAMNLYNRAPHAFTDESWRTGMAFAAHAAVALAQVQENDQLREAIDSRDVIGQAKGILMERHGLTGGQAFQLLTQASQQRNVRLHALAQELVTSRTLKGSRGSI